MQEQHNDSYHGDFLKMLYDILPKLVDICFTANEVEYIRYNLSPALESDNFILSDPRIFQHMYNRFSLAIPHFKAAWTVVENCKSPDKLVAMSGKYPVAARFAAMLLMVRRRTFEWREDCSIVRLEQ